MNSSSSVFLAVLLRQKLGVAFQQNLAVREEQDPVADLCHFVHVVGGPQHAAGPFSGKFAELRANLLGGGRIQRGGRFVQQQKPGMVEHGLGEADPGLFAGGQDPAFGIAETVEVELLKQLFYAGGNIFDAVKHAEDAQVLDHGQISGKRRVDCFEVGALEGARAMFGEVDAIDVNRARGRLEDAENHVDGGRLAGSVGAKKSDNLAELDREGDLIDGNVSP